MLSNYLIAKSLSVPLVEPQVKPLTVLEQIHKGLYKVLLYAVKFGVPKKNRSTGKVTYVKASASLLEIARQFQRDNSPEPYKLPPITEYYK